MTELITLLSSAGVVAAGERRLIQATFSGTRRRCARAGGRHRPRVDHFEDGRLVTEDHRREIGELVAALRTRILERRNDNG